MTQPAVRAARVALRAKVHACSNHPNCRECAIVKRLLDDFESAVRIDERHRIMDNDIASANMGRE